MKGLALCIATLLACALCAFAGPALGAPSAAAPAQAVTGQSATSRPAAAPSGPERLAELERHNAELRYERDIARIHADLVDRQTSWFEILIAAFALITSILVLFLTFRFGQQAVAEAKQAIANERAEIEKLLHTARSMVESIKAHEQRAKAIIADLSPGEVPQKAADRKTLRDVAQTAKVKPIRERSLDEYRALIIGALIDENWAAMERLASEMLLLFEDADAESICFALFNRGYALDELGKAAEAIAAYDELLTRFGESDAPALQAPVARALFNKGVVLQRLGRPSEAIAAFDQLITRFGTSDAPALQAPVAMALFNKGAALEMIGRPEEAIAAYDDLLARFGTSDDRELQASVASALVNKGVALGKLGRADEAIAASDQLITRFGESDAPALQEQVAMALVNRGAVLGKLGRADEAIATYAQLLTRFGESDAPVLQEPLAVALLNYARAHARQGDAAAAVQRLSQLAQRRGSFDCALVAGDTDFDGIRDHPAFQALLAEHGCVPPGDAPPA